MRIEGVLAVADVVIQFSDSLTRLVLQEQQRVVADAGGHQQKRQGESVDRKLHQLHTHQYSRQAGHFSVSSLFNLTEGSPPRALGPDSHGYTFHKAFDQF